MTLGTPVCHPKCKGSLSSTWHPAAPGKVTPFVTRSFANLLATAYAGLRMTSDVAEPAEGCLPEGALRFDGGPIGEFDLLDHYLASGFILRVKVDGQIAPGTARLKAHGAIGSGLHHLHHRAEPCESPPLIFPSCKQLFSRRRDRPAHAHLIAAGGLIHFTKSALPFVLHGYHLGPPVGSIVTFPRKSGDPRVLHPCGALLIENGKPLAPMLSGCGANRFVTGSRGSYAHRYCSNWKSKRASKKGCEFPLGRCSARS